jgi:AcrR family transcriptional regulator
MVQVKNEQRSNISTARPSTAARHQELRDELVVAAERLIEAHGLGQLKARDLAAAVGCSVGAIYNVFTDLDALILEVNANALRALDDDMAGVGGRDPAARLIAMADAYLNYAVTNRRRWDALFEHRLPQDAPAPEWYLEILGAAFSHIEAPLGALRPDMEPAARALLSRSIFSAVHGMAALGLDKRVAPIELAVLREQIGLVVRAIVQGLEGGE